MCPSVHPIPSCWTFGPDKELPISLKIYWVENNWFFSGKQNMYMRTKAEKLNNVILFIEIVMNSITSHGSKCLVKADCENKPSKLACRCKYLVIEISLLISTTVISQKEVSWKYKHMIFLSVFLFFCFVSYIYYFHTPCVNGVMYNLSRLPGR